MPVLSADERRRTKGYRIKVCSLLNVLKVLTADEKHFLEQT
jgi:hypothetical protein